MKSRGVRVLLFVLAVAVLAAAGVGVWQLELRIAAARAAADAFERDARQAVVGLGDWRAAQQAYVAEGQPPGLWLTRAASIGEAVAPALSALRAAAGTAEAQSALEAAIEAFTSAMQSDAKARDYVKSGQRLSASDVIFVEVAPALEKAVIGVDTARGQEQVAFAVAVEELRRWEINALCAAAGVLQLILLLVVPIPRSGEPASKSMEEDGGAEEASFIPRAGGLNLSQELGEGIVRSAQPVAEAAFPPARNTGRTAADRASKIDEFGPIDFTLDDHASTRGPDLDAVADLCASLARVQDTRELQGLLERTAKALDATGVIVWMPDGPQGALRPVLAHGYASLALSRMGIIHPAADNATATAYRTKSVVVVPAEVMASGAVVAPLISSEGCSGAMAVELRAGVEATPQVRAVATIVAAQLATMFTPGTVSSTPLAAAPAAGVPSEQDPAAGRF
jgi:hypothetical protein